MATIQLADGVDAVHVSAGSDITFNLDGPQARVETDNVDLITAAKDQPQFFIVTDSPVVEPPPADEVTD